MFKSPLIVVCALAMLVCGAFVPLQALALVQADPPLHNVPPVKYTTSQKTAQLSPIIVYGQRMPFVAALQLYKTALTRHWSAKPEDRNKLVCEWQMPVGTHFQYLHCETNEAHMRQRGLIQTGIYSTPRVGDQSSTQRALIQAKLPMQLAHLASGKRLARSSLAPILAKLPAADATYTFRVMGDDDKPLMDYVIRDGELTHVYEYVYKHDKSAGAKSGK